MLVRANQQLLGDEVEQRGAAEGEQGRDDRSRCPDEQRIADQRGRAENQRKADADRDDAGDPRTGGADRVGRGQAEKEHLQRERGDDQDALTRAGREAGADDDAVDDAIDRDGGDEAERKSFALAAAFEPGGERAHREHRRDTGGEAGERGARDTGVHDAGYDLGRDRGEDDAGREMLDRAAPDGR